MQSAPVCSGSVSLKDIYNSSHMLGTIEVTVSFMILNQFYDATTSVLDQLYLISVNCFSQVPAIVQG